MFSCVGFAASTGISNLSNLTTGFIALTWITKPTNPAAAGAGRRWDDRTRLRRCRSAPVLQPHTRTDTLTKPFAQKHSIAKFTLSSLEEMKQYAGYRCWEATWYLRMRKAASQTHPLCWGRAGAGTAQEGALLPPLGAGPRQPLAVAGNKPGRLHKQHQGSIPLGIW